MLVRCNKRHICKERRHDYFEETKYHCSHADWHEYTSSCKKFCTTLKLMGLNQIDIDCTETNQPDFITEEDMTLC